LINGKVVVAKENASELGKIKLQMVSFKKEY
jgi:hypothetical protein